MSALVLAWIAGAITLSAAVQFATGFGFALAAVPVLAVVVDAHLAVVLTVCLGTVANAVQAWNGRRVCDRATVARMLAGAVAGLPIGLLVFVHTDDAMLSILIGVAVLLAVLATIRGIDLRQAGPKPDLVGGFLAGVLTTSSSVNGPPLVIVLQARHFAPDRFRATITTAFLALDLIAVVTFAATGEIDSEVGWALLAAVPALVVGAFAGFALQRHLHPERFRKAVTVLLVVAGISALASGFARL